MKGNIDIGKKEGKEGRYKKVWKM